MDTDKKLKDFGIKLKLVTGMWMMFTIGYISNIFFSSDKLPLVGTVVIGFCLLMASFCAFKVMEGGQSD
jgi:F0F1-type ATP synthase assembly protein I